jgi:hypothetical protein
LAHCPCQGGLFGNPVLGAISAAPPFSVAAMPRGFAPAAVQKDDANGDD